MEHRKYFAKHSFNVSSHYDSAIFNYFDDGSSALKLSVQKGHQLRYGENPHQEGYFFGDIEKLFDKLNGKELSYNNLLDIDAALSLMEAHESTDPTFAILKHNNTCGVATRKTLSKAYSEVLGIKKYEDLKLNLNALLTKLRRSGISKIENIRKFEKV